MLAPKWSITSVMSPEKQKDCAVNPIQPPDDCREFQRAGDGFRSWRVSIDFFVLVGLATSSVDSGLFRYWRASNTGSDLSRSCQEHISKEDHIVWWGLLLVLFVWGMNPLRDGSIIGDGFVSMCD